MNQALQVEIVETYISSEYTIVMCFFKDPFREYYKTVTQEFMIGHRRKAWLHSPSQTNYRKTKEACASSNEHVRISATLSRVVVLYYATMKQNVIYTSKIVWKTLNKKMIKNPNGAPGNLKTIQLHSVTCSSLRP